MITYVNGRKVVEKDSVFVIKDRNNNVLTKVRKKIAKNPKEAVSFYLEQEDRRYIRMQDKMWDYV
jgi:hypothetical protein